MKRTKRLVVGCTVAGILAFQGGIVARAHNAGHINLPTGRCQEAGAGNAPQPAGGTNENVIAHNPQVRASDGKIDQNQDPAFPGAQIGTSNAGERGNSEIEREECPVE